MQIATKLDIYKLAHLHDPRRSGRRISITLYDQVDALPNGDEIKERILFQFSDDRGAYKRTHSRRFDECDDTLLAIVKERMPARKLIVHDIGVSDGRTSCDLYERLSGKGSDPLPSPVHLAHSVEKTGGLTPFRTASEKLTLGDRLEFYASDHCPELRVIPCHGTKVVITPEGKLTEMLVPPFVFNGSTFSHRCTLGKRLVRLVALRLVAPRVLRSYKAGRYPKTHTISLFGKRAHNLASQNPNFHLLRYNVLEPSPIPASLTVLRAMNVLNASYFNDKQAALAISNIFCALEEGGLLVSGSNWDAGSPLDGAIYQKRGARFEALWTSGNGHPFKDALAGFTYQPATRAPARLRAA